MRNYNTSMKDELEGWLSIDGRLPPQLTSADKQERILATRLENLDKYNKGYALQSTEPDNPMDVGAALTKRVQEISM